MTFPPQRAAPVMLLFTAAVSLFLFLQGAQTSASTGHEFLNKITRAAYPHAHAVLASEKESVEFETDGTSRETDEVFLTILDQDGVRQNSVTTFYINRHYSRLKIELFEIIGADGKAATVDLDRYAREDSSASASRMNIYDPDQRELRVFIPELYPGDTIHYRVVRENFKTMIPGRFFGKKRAEYTFPIKEYRLDIIGPESVKLHTLIKDGQAGKYSTTEFSRSGRTTRVFMFRDVPALVPEPAMPPPGRVTMRVLYSTINTWDEVGEWYRRLVEPHLAPTPAITTKVRKLTAGKKDREEKLAAIFYFVAQKIRYMGITAERDRPGYEPHDVSLTFSRRYGVCRDKAALLVTMLREAGFHAAPVIISAGSILDAEVVVPWFNHAITALLDEKGKPVMYLDPTSETSRQFLPDYERHSSCLVASPRGSDLLQTPDPEPGANRTLFAIFDRLDADGILSGTIFVTLTGFCDTALRGAMMDSSGEKRKQIIEELIQRRIPGVILHDISWSDPEDRDTPLQFQCGFEAANRTRVTESGNVLFFPAGAMDYTGVLDKYLMEKASLSTRKYPLRFNYVVKSSLIEKIILDSSIRDRGLLLPPCSSSVCPQAVATYRIKYNHDQIILERDFQVRALEVPPEEYGAVLKLQKYLQDVAITPVIIGEKYYVTPLM